MVALAVPKQYDPQAILLADDEREHASFLFDYLERKGFKVSFVTSAAEAFAAAEETRFRAYFIDLNIPRGSWVEPEESNQMYARYVGLHIIRMIRSQGNAGARVIAYSAHYNDALESEIEKLYCKYIIKGRVRELKQAFDDVLKFDPREDLTK